MSFEQAIDPTTQTTYRSIDMASPDQLETRSFSWPLSTNYNPQQDVIFSPRATSVNQDSSQIDQAPLTSTRKRKLSKSPNSPRSNLLTQIDESLASEQSASSQTDSASSSRLSQSNARSRLIPKSSKDKASGTKLMIPPLLRGAIERSGHPSVILAYDLEAFGNSLKNVRITPLQCSYPGHVIAVDVVHASSSQRKDDGDETQYKDFPLSTPSSRKASRSVTEGPEHAKTSCSQYKPLSKTPNEMSKDEMKLGALSMTCNLKTSQDARGVWSGSGKGKGKAWVQPYIETLSADSHYLDTRKIPVEIVEKISHHLNRQDVRNMRLVDHGFEHAISPSLFRSVVVPFNTRVYGRLLEVSDLNMDNDAVDSQRLPSTIDLDLFPGFGEHVRQFGMSFDMDLSAFANPPTKNLQEGVESYWGVYKWPFRYYRRFQDRADLENAADETSTMKLAFSHLRNVQHLALSLDCGLGLLIGQDSSIRAQLLRHPLPIFGKSFDTDSDIATRRRFWNLVENAYKAIDCYDNLKIAELVRHVRSPDHFTINDDADKFIFDLDSSFVLEASTDKGSSAATNTCQSRGYPGVSQMRSAAAGGNMRDRIRNILLNIGNGLQDIDDDEIVENYVREAFDESWSPVGRSDTPTRNEPGPELVAEDRAESLIEGSNPSEDDINSNEDCRPRGLLYTRPVQQDRRAGTPTTPPVSTGSLSTAQKEWLLETAWAQDAFLSSYMIAVTDNPSIFANIKKLTLSRLSSKHVPKLCRSDFWDALAGLHELDMKVVPDHRDVQKTHAGFAQVPSIEPSKAVTVLHYLLNTLVGPKETVQILSVGWTDGGEHAEGVLSRNKLLMPAPLLPKELITTTAIAPPSLLRLPHVRQLELVNCWATPHILQSFIATLRTNCLEKLTLNSFSLTSTSGQNQPQNQAIQHLQALQQLLAQQMAMFPQVQVQPGQGSPGIAQNAGHGATDNVNNVAQAIQNLQQVLANPNNPWNQQAIPAVGIQPHAVGGGPAPAQVHGLPNLNALNLQAPGAGFNIPNQQVQQAAQQQQATHAIAREGSWPHVLQYVKTALNIRSETDNFELSLLSCGYTRLILQPRFDVSIFDEAEAVQHLEDPLPKSVVLYITARKKALEGQATLTVDSHMGSLVSAFPEAELEQLITDWGLAAGWPSIELLGKEYDDDDGWGRWGSKTKEAPEFDGHREGGTGRFSGSITNWLDLVDDSD